MLAALAKLLKAWGAFFRLFSTVCHSEHVLLLQGRVTRACNHFFVRVGKQIGSYGEHAGLLLVGRHYNPRLLGRHAAGGH